MLTAKASGSFIILDATINPRLPGSENSRAGLYLKNMEPNIISASSPNITVFQGFPSVGRSNSLSLHSQWRLEFDITSAENYKNTIATAAANPNTSLSRLYYWSTLTLPQTSEKIMVCMAPLLDAGGRVYGVCGLEISEMLFKMSFMPNDPTFKRMFSALVPVSGETMELSAAMIASGYSGAQHYQGQYYTYFSYKALCITVVQDRFAGFVHWSGYYCQYVSQQFRLRGQSVGCGHLRAGRGHYHLGNPS